MKIKRTTQERICVFQHPFSMMMNVLALRCQMHWPKELMRLFSKKPIESKFQALAHKYCSPENCNLLTVPRVNPGIWNYLSRASRKLEVGLQDLSKSFRSLCSSSTPLSRFLFGDEWSKSVKDITRANKIMAKVMPKKGKTSFWRKARQTSFFAGPLDRITPRALQLQLQQERVLPREAKSLQEGHGEQSVNVSYAGNLANFVENWRQITSDPWILQCVEGYRLEFESERCQPVTFTSEIFWRPASSYWQRGFKVTRKRSYCQGLTLPRIIYFQFILGPKENGWFEASHQSQAIEQVCR